MLDPRRALRADMESPPNYSYLDGESEDDGPDHTECHFDVSVDDLLGTDGHKFDAFAGDEVKSLVNVGDLVEPHLATV